MKRFIFALFLISFAWNASAQYISPFFTGMPDDIFSYLSGNNRKDLVDLYKAGKTAQVENILKGQSALNELSDNFLSLKLSQSTTAQIKLLPLNDTAKVIAITLTVCGPACSSQIRFFTTSWKPIEVKELLPGISLDDFLNKEALAKSTDSSVLQPLDLTFFKYSFSKDSNDLTISLDSENYLSKEDYKRVSPLIESDCKFYWKNGRFSKE